MKKALIIALGVAVLFLGIQNYRLSIKVDKMIDTLDSIRWDANNSSNTANKICDSIKGCGF